MYRKNKLRGFCISCFGLGLMAGHCVESWLLCWLGGVALVVLGLCVCQRK